MAQIEISAKTGGTFSAYIARPEGVSKENPAPVVIVIQEIFGVNQNLKNRCDELATAGFIALCPDLFWRIEAGINLTDQTEAEWARAFELFNAFNIDQGIQDLNDVLAYARNMEDSNRLVSCIGYCLGGKLSYLMSARTSVDISIGYYGVGIQDLLDEAKNITKPLLLHIAQEDEYTDKNAQKLINTALSENSNITIHNYPDMNHAFTRIGGTHYDEHNSTIANTRTLEFLKNHNG
ncbi:MAG: dienelactone hydrolase family protein [Alphaproteobacteria bacterium]|nr:dienelactone hydrolase family protein [Alphaproteobacteria bacterium]